MASGKKSKEARRAAAIAAKTPPRVQSKGGPRRRQASPKLLAAAAGVVALVAIAVVLAIVLTGGKSSTPKNVPTFGSIAAGLPDAADVNAMFKGIPQNGTVLGKPSAPVTMVEYIDLQCPICQEFETTVMPDILKTYVRTGKVKVDVRVWAFIGSDSFRGQAAMLAAARQNKAFNFAQLLYDNQGTENTGWLTDSMVTQAAESIPGLNVHTLLAERSSAAVKAAAKQVDVQANADKVTGTPGVFVGKSGSKPAYVPLQGGGDKATLVKALDRALG